MEENKDIENIDELSRSVIDSHEMNPPEGAWDSLDAELTKKQATRYKKRADRFKLLSIILALILLSFITYNYFSPIQKRNPKGKVTGITLTDNLNNSTAINSDKNEDNPARSQSSREKITPNPKEQSNGIISKSITGSITKSDKAFETGNTSENSFIEENKKVLVSDATKKVIKKNENQFPENDIKRPRSDATTESAFATESSTIDASEEKDFNETKSTDIATNLAENSGKIPEGDTSNAAETILMKRDSATSSSASDPDLSKTKKIASRISVSAFYSPEYIGAQLSDNIPDDAENVEEYRNREQSEYSFSTGMNFRYDLNSRWSLSTGLSFSTLAYSMTYSTIYVGYGEDNQLHYQYPTSCGIIEVPNSGTTILHDGDSFNIKVSCEQLVKFIHIPLTIRYQFVKNRFTWFIDGGFSANFTVQELVKLSFGTFNKTIFNNIDGLKKMNFGFLAGVGSQYNFKNGLGIFIEPLFRGSITSLTQKAPLNCYPYSLGLNTGISLHF